MTTVELNALTVTKDGQEVVRGIDLVLADGSVTALIGPSGSGKTTILRAVAGLDAVTSGTVSLDGENVSAAPPADRQVAFVFQMPILLATRSAGANISFPLEVQRRPSDEIDKRVVAEARALQIEALLARRPSTLSIGEAQVVQIARAMVRRPRVLLLDEPFSKLDAPRAVRLRREVAMIQRGFGVTTLMATNDPLDAMTMADRLAVIDSGQITQVGCPLDVFDRPATVLAALLTGETDVLTVDVTGDVDGSWLVAPGLRMRAWQPALRHYRGRRLQLVVRPSWWELDRNAPVKAIVARISGSPAMRRIGCRLGERVVDVQLFASPNEAVAVGDAVGLRLRHYALIDPRSGFRVDVP